MYAASQTLIKRQQTELRTGVGAAYGTAKSGIGIANVGTFRPDLIMKVPFRRKICVKETGISES
jgi:hypothetical protein